MLRPFGSEQGNFSLFIILVLLSAWLFTLPAQSFWASGGAMMIWGAFGFWRLAVISFYEGRSSKLASLPARLMATLDEREHRLRVEGHSRLHHLDIQLWFALGCAYVAWVGVNFIAPAPLESLKDLQLSLNEFWHDVGGRAPEVRLGGNRDALIRQGSFLFCAGVAAFTVHSFAYNENFIRQAALIILPFFALSAGILIITGMPLAGVPIMDDLAWRGAGSGAAVVAGAMIPELKDGQSVFMQRLIEQGYVGADVIYLLYLLPAWALVRFMLRSGRRMVCLLTLAVLAMLGYLDMMMQASGAIKGLLFMGSAFVALAWGHSAYLRPYWAPRIEEELEDLTKEQN